MSQSRLLNKGAGLRPAISGFDSNNKTAVRNRVGLPNFGVRDVLGQKSKNIYQAPYLLRSDFPNNFF